MGHGICLRDIPLKRPELGLPAWSTPLPPRPITIPRVMTLTTLADVRKLIGRIPKERRALFDLAARRGHFAICPAGVIILGNIGVALQIVLQGRERVPYKKWLGASVIELAVLANERQYGRHVARVVPNIRAFPAQFPVRKNRELALN